MANIGRATGAYLNPVVVGQSSIELTGSGVIAGNPGFLAGIFVASGSSPTIILYDNPSAGSGTVLVNTFTPNVGWNPCPIPYKTGLYATIGGTLDATFIFS